MTQERDSDKMEMDLLLEGIRRRYGYDFSHYAQASLCRRLDLMRGRAGVRRYTELLDRILHDEALFDDCLRHLSIPVTQMFRDPSFFAAVRSKLIPVLKTFPFVKIWHAGCATGEEAYSMAIVLLEENFLDRARIYATDFNQHSLSKAEQGVYSAAEMELYASNYAASGGRRNFTDYYHAGYELAKMKDYLKERITFSYHNLVTDGVFGEMNLIVCRNVLIYFDRVLQERAFTLFRESLCHGGFLCLGGQETINFTGAKPFFEPVAAREKIYRKREAAHA